MAGSLLAPAGPLAQLRGLLLQIVGRARLGRLDDGEGAACERGALAGQQLRQQCGLHERMRELQAAVGTRTLHDEEPRIGRAPQDRTRPVDIQSGRAGQYLARDVRAERGEERDDTADIDVHGRHPDP